MGILHGTPAVVLWTTCCPADHFGHQVLEPWWQYAMVGFIHARIGIQSWIDHDSVNEIIDDRSDVIHPTEPIIERYLFWALHSQPPCLLRMHTCLSPENIRTTLEIRREQLEDDNRRVVDETLQSRVYPKNTTDATNEQSLFRSRSDF